MNFHFNEEEQEILNMLHDYAVKEVAPRAHEIDEEEKFPMEARNGLAEMGMMGMYFPEEYSSCIRREVRCFRFNRARRWYRCCYAEDSC